MSRLVTANLMLVTRPDFPASTPKELIDEAKKNPGKLNYGTVGAGGVNHLAMAWFNTQNGLEMQHVALQGPGAGPAGHHDRPPRRHVRRHWRRRAVYQGGKMKGLAVSGKSRHALIPDVPTFAETGMPDFDASFYFALAAPAGTRRETVAKMAADSAKIINTAEFKERLTTLGFEPVGDTPEQFGAFLKHDRELAAKKVKASGAKLD